jgi:uncharacterized protein YjbI with pentapeptide repeats
MSEAFKNPNEVVPSREGKPIHEKIKFSFAGTLSAVIRTAIDLSKPVPSPGAGTLPEWIKAIGFKGDIEKEAYVLLTNSLIKACRAQMRSRFEEVFEDEEKKTFLYLDREVLAVSGEIKQGIATNRYTLDIKDFDNPANMVALLQDFKEFYEWWIRESFPISEVHARHLTAEFPDYFAYQLQMELGKNGGDYPEILKAYNNPFNDKVAYTLARRKYKLKLKERYHWPALGEPDIALSDVYVEPDFLVYDRILSKEKRKQLREKEFNRKGHFLQTDFEGSVHHYLRQYFLTGSQSKAIGEEIEQSRLLILMGQPGHGKSSFCYRSLHDLLQAPDFSGNVFFVRLQEASRDILNTPITGMENTTSFPAGEIGFRELIENSSDQKNVVFLDGLDEFYMTKSLSDGDVLQFLQNLKSLLGKHKNLYFIITSRFNYVETSKLYNEDCLLFSLGTLSQRQQQQMVDKYRRRVGQDRPCKLGETAIQEVNKDHNLRHIKELIELPILLQMILISGVDVMDTGSKAKVYDELFTTVLERKWDKDKRLEKYQKDNKFKKEHLRAYLAFLAYKIFQYNKGYLNKSEVAGFDETRRFVEKRLRIEHEQGELKEVLKDILTSFYLKESKKAEGDRTRGDDSHDYAIEFLHKSLYEYLACEHLWTATKKFFLDKDADDPEECKDYKLEEVQQKIQDLFALTSMTEETMGHMDDIILRDTKPHEKLSERMGHYLPRLLKRGFLYEYKSDSPTNGQVFTPEQQALNVFHLYQLILGQLCVHQVETKRFLGSEWEELQKDPAFVKHRAGLGEAYRAYLDGIYEMYSTESRTKKVDEESGQFDQWLSGTLPDIAETKTFENWIRHQLLRKEGLGPLQFLADQIEKGKPAFVQQLRLLGAARMPMKLPLYFAPLEKMNGYGLYAPGLRLSGADLSRANLSRANLSRANLSRANLSRANLRSADLRSANLRSANLRSANLSSADLSRADLISANLISANLSSADLSGAYLSGAYLISANLRSADLSGAYLSGVYLSGAYLSGANLSGANLSRADLSRADLEGARVDQADWLEQLQEWEVEGLDWVLANYTVSTEKKTFNDRYSLVYEAYEILKREKSEGDQRRKKNEK